MKYTDAMSVIHAMKLRHLQTLAVIVFAFIILTLGWYVFLRKDSGELVDYSNPAYGVAFSYPKQYTLTESPSSGAQQGTIATLTDRGVHVPVNSDAPTAITIGMFTGTGTSTKGDPLATWIKTSPYANYSLSKSTLGTTTVAGTIGRLYTWDGLYQGTSVAVLHDGNVILFTVTYNGEADLKKRQDFTNLMQTVRFFNSQNH